MVNIMNKPATPTNNPEYNVTWAIIVFTTLSTLSFLILKNDFISEPSFVIFILLTTIFSFAILCLNRVTVFKVKDFQVTLREMKATETAIKELALLTLETIEADRVTSFHTTDTSKEDPYIEVSERLRKLSTS